MKAYIIRHGQTSWNKSSRWQGNTDIPLDDTGITQAKKLTEKLTGYTVDIIYSSPLIRAYETAKIIKDGIKKEIILHEQLREINLGEWAGLTLAEMKNSYCGLYDKWNAGEPESVGFGVEDFISLQNRAYEAFLDICLKEYESVLVVTHGTLISALICKLLHIPLYCRDSFEISNAGVSIVSYNKHNRKFTVETLNALLY